MEYNFNLNLFAIRLKEERQRLQLKQDGFAQMGHVSSGSQAGYEAGSRAPDAKYLALLENNGVDVLYLLSGEKAKKYAATHFDWEKHNAILQIIEKWTHSLDIEVEFEMKMEIFKVIFIVSVEKDDIDQELIEKYLKLFARALNNPPHFVGKIKASQ